jgi:serine/threonine protein kinase
LKNLIAIFRKVLLGLAYIHSKGIIHRDLKPQNIMIDEATMTPKLIDFGLSLLFNAKTDKKKFKRCGTIGYMAHEVISNVNEKKKCYDCKCDMFSFGIIAHMMLMGFNPIKGQNYIETVKKNEECVIVLDEKQILSKYHTCGYEFLDRLLQKESIDRWSAEEALRSAFINQKFEGESEIVQSRIKEILEEKELEAQYECEDEQVTILKFKNFEPKKKMEQLPNNGGF